MGSLGGLYWDIVCARCGAQKLPTGGALLAVVAAAYFAVSVLDAYVVLDLRHALVLALADCSLTFAVFALALGVRGRRHRIAQTLSGVLGVGAIFGLPMASLGIAAAIWHRLATPLDLVMVGIEAWAILVVARIAREALDVPLFNGLAVSTTYFALEFMLVAWIAPH